MPTAAGLPAAVDDPAAAGEPTVVSGAAAEVAEGRAARDGGECGSVADGARGVCTAVDGCCAGSAGSGSAEPLRADAAEIDAKAMLPCALAGRGLRGGRFPLEAGSGGGTAAVPVCTR